VRRCSNGGTDFSLTLASTSIHTFSVRGAFARDDQLSRIAIEEDVAVIQVVIIPNHAPAINSCKMPYLSVAYQ
jgi:hypothetical protein